MHNLYLESALMSFAETIRNEKEKRSIIVSEKWTVSDHLFPSRRARSMANNSTHWRGGFCSGKCEVKQVVFP